MPTELWGSLNDLWEFNPSENEWMWMGGSITNSQSGMYGTEGTPAGGNIPGARYDPASWIDSSGNFWLFGGNGYDATGNQGDLNDLWEFYPSTNEWVWMGGSTMFNQEGVYGTLGTTASGNIPEARYIASSWTDANGNFWLFGGWGIDAYGNWGPLNDLWKYQLATTSLSAAAKPAFSVASGTYSTTQTVTISDTMAGATIYYTTNGTTPTTSSSVYSSQITVSYTETLEAIATLSGYSTSAVAAAAYTITTPGETQAATTTTLTSSLNPSGFGQPVTFTATVSSNTTGTPSGTMTFSNGDTTLESVPLSGSSASITTSALPEIPSSITAVYSGDSNFAGSISNTVSQEVTDGLSAASEWTWMGGSTGNNNIPGVYGTQGTFAPGNIPGDRNDPMSWTDANGNFWFFGGWGSGADSSWGLFNDLWKFNPATNEWAWMKGASTLPCDECSPAGVYGTLGSFAAANMPGARQDGATWTDVSGNLWLFGGYGYDVNDNEGYLNDLWEFNTSTNQWAWMGGSNINGQSDAWGNTTEVPGGRSGASTWTDGNGNLWLFGGYGYDAYGNQGYSNDMWTFIPSAKLWVCFYCGSNNQSGMYGISTPPSWGIPGSREGATSWTDASGNLWLFGGNGYDAYGNQGNLNDLWEWNSATWGWTWMGGSNTNSQWGIYGTMGIPAAGNIPGAREWASSWTDMGGNLWLFGGTGNDGIGYSGDLNDLWVFKPSTNKWTWMAGSVVDQQPGVYGTEGTPAAADTPGSRHAGVSWTDKSGNLWLFGGWGWGSCFDCGGGSLADLWKYQPAVTLSLSGATTTTKLSSTPNPSIYGETVSFTATVSSSGGAPPNGEMVRFVNGATMLPLASSVLSGGKASFAITTLPVGASSIKAIYIGDANYAASYSTAVSQTVSKDSTTTTLSSSLNPSAFAQQVTLTATVSGQYGGYPSGTVTFKNGSVTLGSSYLGGNSASLTITVLPEGTDSITAVYGGDGTFTGSTSNVLKQVVGSEITALREWTWMGGSSVIPDSPGGKSGVYGTLGKPAAGNMPGSRMTAASWTDLSGNLWLFGGDGYDAVYDWDNQLNDMWEFKPSTNEWTWMGGASYVAGSGCNPGIYGALGTPAAANIPGGRSDASKWTDLSGNLWLFGGQGCDGGTNMGQLNDLWEFNPTTNEWTWVSGSSIDPIPSGGMPGVYGTLGVPAAGNVPGGRYGAVSWTDKSGNLWLFGGSGNDAADKFGYLNDLWMFNPATNQWAWMGGSSALDESFCKLTNVTYITSGDCGRPGAYGTMGTPSAGNVPGGREYAATWTDSGGNLWLFGGYGFGALEDWSISINHGTPFIVTTAVDGYLNDLWEFSPSTNEWTWMGGSNTFNMRNSGAYGVYGTQGTPAAGNVPAGRHCASRWTDKNGNLWLYGGWGIGYNNVFGTAGELNDLWEFNPSTQDWTWMSGNSNVNCTGTCGFPDALYYDGVYGALGTPAAANLPGSRRGVSNANWTDASGNLWLFGGYGYDSVSSYPVYLNDLWKYQPLATPVCTWPAPAPILYPAALSANQLDASCTTTVSGSVVTLPGTFAYSPASGTVPYPGTKTLSATFTPADTADYSTATLTTQLTVNQAAGITSPTPGNNSRQFQRRPSTGGPA